MWKHKGYPSRTYRGTYRIVKGRRKFVLSTIVPKTGMVHNIYFVSHEGAKKDNWQRVENA